MPDGCFVRAGDGWGRCGRGCRRVEGEPVAGAVNGDDPDGLGGILLEFAAERDDVLVHGAGGGEEGEAPGAIEEFVTGNHLTGAFDEEAEDIEFAGGEGDFGVVAPDAAGREVDANGAEADPGGGGDGGATAQEGADAGKEFLAAEGFDQVIVGAEVEAADAILDAASGGEDEDGAVEAESPQVTAEGEAVEAGEHEIEKDQVGLAVGGEGEASLAVGGGEDAVAVPGEAVVEHGAHGRFVLDDEDAFPRAVGVAVGGSG